MPAGAIKLWCRMTAGCTSWRWAEPVPFEPAATEADLAAPGVAAGVGDGRTSPPWACGTPGLVAERTPSTWRRTVSGCVARYGLWRSIPCAAAKSRGRAAASGMIQHRLDGAQHLLTARSGPDVGLGLCLRHEFGDPGHLMVPVLLRIEDRLDPAVAPFGDFGELRTELGCHRVRPLERGLAGEVLLGDRSRMQFPRRRTRRGRPAPSSPPGTRARPARSSARLPRRVERRPDGMAIAGAGARVSRVEESAMRHRSGGSSTIRLAWAAML